MLKEREKVSPPSDTVKLLEVKLQGFVKKSREAIDERCIKSTSKQKVLDQVKND